MKRPTVFIRIACMLLFLVMFSGSGSMAFSEESETIPPVWNITVQANDAVCAAKQICLMYRGNGHWANADIQTMGVYILSEEEVGNKITLCLYTARGVFDVSTGAPVRVAGGKQPVRIVFTCVDNAYTLVSYQEPEDGANYYSSMQTIFGKKLADRIIENQEEYGNLAAQDALNEAHNYISGEDGTWIEFLDTGSNASAATIVTNALPGWYPSYDGKAISYLYKRMYTLTVEEEYSYSGTLTFQSFDIAGNQLSHVTIRVEGDDIVVLEGEMPPLYE